MTKTFCDNCGFELELGIGIRVTDYGMNTGITVVSAFKKTRWSIEKHYCSGECMIRNVDFLNTIPTKRLAAI